MVLRRVEPPEVEAGPHHHRAAVSRNRRLECRVVAEGDHFAVGAVRQHVLAHARHGRTRPTAKVVEGLAVRTPPREEGVVRLRRRTTEFLRLHVIQPDLCITGRLSGTVLAVDVVAATREREQPAVGRQRRVARTDVFERIRLAAVRREEGDAPGRGRPAGVVAQRAADETLAVRRPTGEGGRLVVVRHLAHVHRRQIHHEYLVSSVARGEIGHAGAVRRKRRPALARLLGREALGRPARRGRNPDRVVPLEHEPRAVGVDAGAGSEVYIGPVPPVVAASDGGDAQERRENSVQGSLHYFALPTYAILPD